MKKLRVAVVKRGSLADILRGIGRVGATELESVDGKWDTRLDPDVVAVGYFEGHYQLLPSLLVVPGVSRREFFAWVNTYCPFATPLSQWCRVLTDEEMRELEDFTVLPKYGNVASAWAGAVIGEALMHLGRLDGSAELNVAGLQSCSSFVAARSYGLWGSKRLRSVAVTRYVEARDILGTAREQRVFSGEQVWDVLEGLTKPSAAKGAESSAYIDLAIQSCREIQERGFVGERTITRVLGALEWSRELAEFERLGAEQRVELFDRAVESLMGWSKRGVASNDRASEYGALAEFAVSYFAVRIGGGASGHIRLIEKLMAAYPTLALWYGMASGLHRPGVWGAEFSGVGRLAVRELSYPLRLDDAPRCDIVFDELLAMVEPGADSRGLGFRGANLRGLKIEVGLGVDGTVRLSNMEESEGERMDRVGIQAEVDELDRFLRAARESARRLGRMYVVGRIGRRSESGGAERSRSRGRTRTTGRSGEQGRLPMDGEERDSGRGR